MRLLLSVALLSSLVIAPAAAAAAPDGGPRLRPQDSRTRLILQEGAARSTTFKALVERIEASNVIVYIAINPLLKSTLSGSLTWMTQAGGYRYLRASISPDLLFDQMIATMAHELQHAVEVIGDEGVKNEKTLVELYRRIGQRSQHASAGWETIAAQETGWQVRRELVSVPANTIARAGEWTRS